MPLFVVDRVSLVTFNTKKITKEQVISGLGDLAKD